MQFQTYTISRSSHDNDIISAAEQRAAFWGYPSNGPWTVYVKVGKREVAVKRDNDGVTTIER